MIARMVSGRPSAKYPLRDSLRIRPPILVAFVMGLGTGRLRGVDLRPVWPRVAALPMLASRDRERAADRSVIPGHTAFATTPTS